MKQPIDVGPMLAKPAFGTPAPWFRAQVLNGNPNYAFDTVAGRPVVLFFMGSAGIDAVHSALEILLASADYFDDVRCCFFGITLDPEDVTNGRIETRIPGIRYVLDYDRAVSIAYGAGKVGSGTYEPYIMVLDRQLRVAGRFLPSQASEALALVDRLGDEFLTDGWAPVLMVPRILEPELCRKMVQLYDTGGGQESGFMREVNGKTVTVFDHAHKRRSDIDIKDENLRRALRDRINQRLVPAIKRAFNFDTTRMERYIVACYDSADGAHFSPHRDNTTKGTAHRRFAVTVNLNDEFQGGELCFPEFGTRCYRPPPGGAIVFACGLLHEAKPVTQGRRYAFLPFLYDDAAAALRKENNIYLGEGEGAYQQD